MQKQQGAEIFETEAIWKILIHLAPPVMLAQLIQALYNVVDSYFVGKYSEEGLTALSVIYPVQVFITALAVGTGVGVNTLMARYYAQNDMSKANKTAGTGIVLAILSWGIFAGISTCLLHPFVEMCAQSQQAKEDAIIYGMIVCIGSLGLFMESCFSKVHQAAGNMKLPTLAQVAGAVTNIILDPVLIFGYGGFPKLEIAGAAIATVCGQIVAAVITGITAMRKPPAIQNMLQYVRPIYRYGFPSIFMQVLYVVYIMILNMILSGFTDAAVTVLGLYYKLQSFFFIPMFALQTCIVPVMSFNYCRGSYSRCREVVRDTIWISAVLMCVGVFCFECIPAELIHLFSQSDEVIEVGVPAFRIIGLSFIPCVFSQVTPTIFQSIGEAKQSIILALTRQIFCLIPIFWLLSLIGLGYTWIAFPAAEVITGTVGMYMYWKEVHRWKKIKSSN